MTSTPDTRYSLIAKLRDSQDVQAWNEFASIYQPLIFRVVAARGLQYADATDVTQEVLARVAKVVEQFDPAHASVTFRGWLYRIARNITVDFLRKQNRDRAQTSLDRSTDLLALASPTAGESAEFRLQFEKQIFWVVAQDVRSQVETRTWQAFWETEIERRPVADLAQELNLSVGAVYIARSRVLAKLKKQVQLRMLETGIEQLCEHNLRNQEN